MRLLLLLFLVAGQGLVAGQDVVAGQGVVAVQNLGLNVKQIKGLKSLLKNLDGVYPTCNLILFSELADYETAQSKCENLNIGTASALKGNLATVDDEEKNTDLKLLLEMAYPYDRTDKWGDNQWVWAGLRKTKNNDKKGKKGKYSALDWEWANGSHPTDFKMWMKGQPDQRVKDGFFQNQMRINHKGVWDDTWAFRTHPYACDYKGKYILSGTLKTWSQAKAACEDAGLMLAKVRSDAEVEEMKNAAVHFIGPQDEKLKVFDPNNWIWLGGSDADEEGVWTWIDGTPMEYYDQMNWRPPNPDHASFIRGSTQHYLAMSKSGEFDDSYDHRRKKRPFACQCPGT